MHFVRHIPSLLNPLGEDNVLAMLQSVIPELNPAPNL